MIFGLDFGLVFVFVLCFFWVLCGFGFGFEVLFCFVESWKCKMLFLVFFFGVAGDKPGVAYTHCYHLSSRSSYQVRAISTAAVRPSEWSTAVSPILVDFDF